MQETDIKVEWDVDEYDLTSSSPALLINNAMLTCYDYEDFGKEWNLIDCLPTSSTDVDVKLLELSTSTALDTPLLQAQEIKPETSEPCSAALAIEANIPAPKPSIISKWRTFISSAYYHPNILVHQDVSCLLELFQLLGRHIDYGSSNIMIDLDEDPKEYKPIFNLRPALHPLLKPPQLTFALIKDFFVDNELKICIVKKYSIIDSMRNAVQEMVHFIVEYPEALYLETYGFILDFLLKFGTRSDVIIDAVMRTQRRRRKSQEPASVLVLKKANKLGNKGKKEFLQKRLSSHKKRYDPVVPILREPPPIRKLRNRTTGGDDGEGHRTPAVSSEGLVHSDPINSTSGFTPSKLKVAKRQLFQEVSLNSNNIQQEEETASANESFASANDLLENPVSTNTFRATDFHNKPKKFYTRRDKSLIETPFTCPLCPERSFAYKGNLVLHMKKKHSAEAANKIPKKRPPRGPEYIPPFTCPVCVVGYSTKYKCKVHIQQFHPDQKDWQPIPNVTSPDLSPAKRTRSTRADTTDRTISSCQRDPKSQIDDKATSVYEESTSQSFPNNINAGLCVHPFTSGQELDFHVGSDINVAFDGLQFETFNQVATRQQFQTAVK